jgi:hypothetical protein
MIAGIIAIFIILFIGCITGLSQTLAFIKIAYGFTISFAWVAGISVLISLIMTGAFVYFVFNN